jgi:hypothetical protein
MTDKDIIKGLKRCSSYDDCRDCPFKKGGSCIARLSEEALGLIDRQRKEIAWLKARVGGDPCAEKSASRDDKTVIKVDGQGRVKIPKVMRETMGMGKGEVLEVHAAGEMVCFRRCGGGRNE